MIRAAALLLLLGSACTVPDLEELYCDGDVPSLTRGDVEGGVDAVIDGESASSCGQGVVARVSYTGFLPGCIRVVARSTDDTPGEGARFVDVAGKGESGIGGSLTVFVLPAGDWGRSVTLETLAFENACVGSPAVSQSATVTLMGGTSVEAALQMSASDMDRDGFVSVATGGSDCQDTQAAINPGAQERCNDTDDNCNGQRDEGLQLDQACTVGDSCAGLRRCGADGAVVCTDIPPQTQAYPDADGDRYGDRNAAAVRFCGVVPSNYVTRNDDCDDTQPSVYPGAPERCDYRDNNCNGSQDEGFPNLGMACTTPAQNPGQFVCNASGSGTVCQDALELKP